MPIEAQSELALPEMPVEAFAGHCARCDNFYPATYYRGRHGREYRLCAHCIDLELTGKKHTGQGGGRHGNDVASQLNQPPVHKMFPGGRQHLCPWCGRLATPEFRMYGYTFRACGWACAGMYFDWVIEVKVVNAVSVEDLEYVRTSLGARELS